MSASLATSTEEILSQLGYPDVLSAARQHARLLLLGRLAHYEAATQQLEAKWGSNLQALADRYAAEGVEQAEIDDDYLEWRWYDEALKRIRAQLDAISHDPTA